MLAEQIDRIRLIEKLVHSLWNIGLAGWGSGHQKSSKIIMKILNAIMNNDPLTVGYASDNLIPPHAAKKFPMQLVDELRNAGITPDDIEKVKDRRAANTNLIIELVEKMFERGYRFVDNIESHLNAVISGQPSRYVSTEDAERLRKAEIIKFDYSGFLCRARIELMKILFEETNLTPHKVISLVTSQTEKNVGKMADHILSNKEKIENDFDRLKWHNITGQEAIADLINIGNDLGSRYAHIRSTALVIGQGFDFTIVKYLAEKMAPVLDSKFASLKSLPVESVHEPVIHVKTPEELAAEKQIKENAVATLVTHFHVEKEDAINTANSLPVNYLRSLWSIKINVMPRIEKVLEELMETFHGNVQMVKDIVQLEQLVWANETEAYRKYSIPVQRSKYGMNPVSVISNDQSDALLTIDKDLLPTLIKPLETNLTLNYKLKHPGQEVLNGRDLNAFKKYAYIYRWKNVPEFMFNNTNIPVINSTDSSGADFIEPNYIEPNTIEPNFHTERPTTSNDLLLGLDIIMIALLLGYLYYLYRVYNRRRYFIETTNVDRSESVSLIVKTHAKRLEQTPMHIEDVKSQHTHSV
jgi:hypothetical protein